MLDGSPNEFNSKKRRDTMQFDPEYLNSHIEQDDLRKKNQVHLEGHQRKKAFAFKQNLEPPVQSKPEHFSATQGKHYAKESISTVIENQEIPESLNRHNLKMSLKKMYDTNPNLKLRQILQRTRFNNQLTPSSRTTKSSFLNTSKKSIERSTEAFKKTPNRLTPNRKKPIIATDSSLRRNEAKLIMDELKSINEPKIWEKVLKNFKKKPELLLDLIPLPENRYCLTSSRKFTPRIRSTRHGYSPSRNNKNPSKSPHSRTGRLKIRNKRRSQTSSPKEEVPRSTTPIEVQTLLHENPEESLTEDWHLSLLNFLIREKKDPEVDMLYEDELECLIRGLPTDEHQLEAIFEKGNKTLNELLIEMLGTKEDVERFTERFSSKKRGQIRELLAKCLDLWKVRKETEVILRLIHKREALVKDRCNTREEVLKIYKLGKEIREKLDAWVKDELIPFDKFVYKGRNYIQKISEDVAVLQKKLASRDK